MIPTQFCSGCFVFNKRLLLTLNVPPPPTFKESGGSKRVDGGSVAVLDIYEVTSGFHHKMQVRSIYAEFKLK